MKIDDFITTANHFGKEKQPFLFIIDFEMNKPFVCKLEQAGKFGYYFDIKGNTNQSRYQSKQTNRLRFISKPVSKKIYSKAFNIVLDNLKRGNSYLLNLTFPAAIETNMSLEEIYFQSRAPYKLIHLGNFVIFSPESFIKIQDNTIYSYPMKGTIDAKLPNARKLLLQDEKETREHNTIVDLIRNDISIVAENVYVSKYRYVEKIETNKNQLLQVSSEIKGKLNNDWRSKIGEILTKLLPAGSISGAPKQKTVEIIKEVEQDKRGYYTGIFGIYDGKNIDSAVNIRYIEKTAKGLQFRSGGGITAMSEMEDEYQEMVEKIYVPFS